jgi:hypothetical protein
MAYAVEKPFVGVLLAFPEKLQNSTAVDFFKA